MISRDMAVSVSASLGAAAAFGLASALQHAESEREERRASLDPRLLVALVRHPAWLLGGLADIVAVALQAVALRYGPVTFVQPLLVLGLPFAVVASCALARHLPTRDQLTGVTLCSVGLAAFGLAAATTAVAREPQPRTALLAALVLAALVLVLLRAPGRTAAVTAGCAAGVTVGAGSVLLAVCAARFDHLGSLLRGPLPYVTVAVGLVGLLLSQSAFQTGAIGAPLAALSLTEPAIAVVLAVTVLHERVTASPALLVLGAAGVLAASAGVVLLVRDGAAGRPHPRAACP